MPDPRKFVAQAVEVLVRLGMDSQDATDTVEEVARTVRFRLAPYGNGEGNWLTHVVRAAADMVAVPDPSYTEHTGDDHADGTGS